MSENNQEENPHAFDPHYSLQYHDTDDGSVWYKGPGWYGIKETRTGVESKNERFVTGPHPSQMTAREEMKKL